jgi:hypothetical protein
MDFVKFMKVHDNKILLLLHRTVKGAALFSLQRRKYERDQSTKALLVSENPKELLWVS